MARQKAQYNTRQVLELAIEVDKAQGFIKSGYGYFDKESDKRIDDNKTTILNMLEGATDMMPISNETFSEADKIIDEFKQELIAKKLSGSINDFESNVSCVVLIEISPTIVLNTLPSTPIMSPKSSHFLNTSLYIDLSSLGQIISRFK